jgi:NAD(P)-dependent dehydrogenase (short-subunit alcohol dehydrogenase family)
MKTILITGSTDGIGKQTALEIAEMGYEVILHGRNEIKGILVKEDIIRQTGNEHIHYVNGDFTDFSNISAFADQINTKFSKLDILLNNAGVMNKDKVILPNGIEITFMVNHLAYFALTLHLIDLVKESPEGRIVNVSSQAQAGTMDFDNLNGEKYYDMYNAYALSKLENVLFTYRLARELEGTEITANALHPGVIATKLLHTGWGGGGAPVETGARTTVFTATAETLIGKSGLYFVNAKERRSSAISYDRTIQDRLWEISLEYSQLTDPFTN